MQITRAGEYAILGVTHLARKGTGRAVMIEEICRQEGISKSFLAKIFQTLARAGIVRSQRGAGGGFKLARPPEKISLLEILEAAEGKITLQRCLQEPVDCRKAAACTLCDIFTEVQHRVKNVFLNTSLADLIQPKTEVARHLGRLHEGGSRSASPIRHGPEKEQTLSTTS